MGWLIEQKKDKYRVYSTISDEYITEYIGKEELVRFVFWHKFERFMEDMLKEMICFPHGWTEKKTGKLMHSGTEKHEEYFEIIRDRKTKYVQFLNKLEENGVSLALKDIDGVEIFTHRENDK
jgi:hypothetical protein